MKQLFESYMHFRCISISILPHSLWNTGYQCYQHCANTDGFCPLCAYDVEITSHILTCPDEHGTTTWDASLELFAEEFITHLCPTSSTPGFTVYNCGPTANIHWLQLDRAHLLQEHFIPSNLTDTLLLPWTKRASASVEHNFKRVTSVSNDLKL